MSLDWLKHPTAGLTNLLAMGKKNNPEKYKPSHQKGKPWKAYCAIDVGSVSCGYAYSFEDTPLVWLNDNWADNFGYFAYRAPSAIVYDSSGQPVKFGSEACDWFISKSAEERENYEFYYDGLLNHSYPDEITTDDNIVDETPVSTNQGPQKLHSTVMKHRVDLALMLSLHCKNHVENKYRICGRNSPDEIVWSYAVPASWDIDQKKTFKDMILQGFQLKQFDILKTDAFQVLLVTTTEAIWTALYGKNLPELDTKHSTIMLVHAGGSCTELSIHMDKYGIAPIVTQSINIGGSYLNQVFEGSLCELFGSDEDFVEKMKKQNPHQWLEVLTKFEHIKPSFSYEPTSDASMDVDYGFIKSCSDIIGMDLVGKVSGSQLSICSLGKISLSADTVKWLNLKACSEVAKAINEVWPNLGKEKLTSMILTGGFGGSSFLKSYLLKEQRMHQLTETKIHVAEDPATLVNKGVLLSSKERPELGCSYALVYNSSSFGSCEQDLVKVHPIFSKGQEIEVGRCAKYGPFELDMFYDKSICYNICQVYKHMEAGVPRLLSKFGDNKNIDTIELAIRQDELNKRHIFYILATMDATTFKVTLLLESVEPKRKVSVICPYGSSFEGTTP